MYHSAISLTYMEERLHAGKSAHLVAKGRKGGDLPMARQREQVTAWRSQGYTYAPPCDCVLPDGRCAGHEKEA